MRTWERVKLKDVVRFWIKGSTPERSRKEYYTNQLGIPWVRVGDLKGREVEKTEHYLTNAGAKQIKGDMVPAGAVLLSVSGTIGKVAIAGTDLKVNQAICAMVFDESRVLSEYAYYYLQFYSPWLEARANTVTIPNLTKAQLQETYILLPCLQEQQFIVGVMRRAEDMQRKQDNMLSEINNVLYSAVWHKLEQNRLSGTSRRLEAFLSEPVLTGLPRQKEGGESCIFVNAFYGEAWSLSGFENYPEMSITEQKKRRYCLKKGDLLLARGITGQELKCILVDGDLADADLNNEDLNNAVFGNAFLRIRVRTKELRPEFLLAWLYFNAECKKYDFFRGKSYIDLSALNHLPVPEVEPVQQDKIGAVVRRILKIRRQLSEAGKMGQQFFSSMLAAAFFGNLSKGYRALNHIESPDRTLLLQHYHVSHLEPVGVRKAGNTDWRQVFGPEKRQLIERLSDFQKAVLDGFLNCDTPMPIHAVHKQIRKHNPSFQSNYSVQDAIATVKVLEGLGFLEKTIPEKLYLEDTELVDAANQPITIQNYKVIVKETE